MKLDPLLPCLAMMLLTVLCFGIAAVAEPIPGSKRKPLGLLLLFALGASALTASAAAGVCHADEITSRPLMVPALQYFQPVRILADDLAERIAVLSTSAIPKTHLAKTHGHVLPHVVDAGDSCPRYYYVAGVTDFPKPYKVTKWGTVSQEDFKTYRRVKDLLDRQWEWENRHALNGSDYPIERNRLPESGESLEGRTR